MRLRVFSSLLVVMLVLIAGCGSSGPSQEELAAQDKQVEAANRAEAARARVVAAAHRLKLQRQPARLAVIRARRARRLREVRRQTLLQPVGFSAADLCAPIRGGGPASRRERRMLRRQALYNLNLRC